MFKVISGADEIKSELERIKNRRSYSKEYEQKVLEILANVEEKGDEALIEYTKKLDGFDLTPQNIRVSKDELASAHAKADRQFLKALSRLTKNITEFHKKEKETEWFEQLPHEVFSGMRNIAVDSAGIYVPGGRAPYPSSVLMNAIPAKIAGVSRIAMVSPPPIDPNVLAAAYELGISEIYRIGGAQAIAALAYGTQTVRKVDKITGPGNIFVSLAKKFVSDKVGVDSFAGPSDILIAADSDAEPEFIAADLLSQCEHDPNASAILITDSNELKDKVLIEVESQIKKLKKREMIERSIQANGRIFMVEKLKESHEIINEIAPEHLELLIPSPQRFLEKVRNAGAVFLGPYSPVALGDYGAGPNHILPSFGAARFSSPLGVYDFIKKQSVLGYTKGALSEIKSDILKLAEIEGFDAHKNAIEVRFS